MRKLAFRKIVNKAYDNSGLNAQSVKIDYTPSSCVITLKNIHNMWYGAREKFETEVRKACKEVIRNEIVCMYATERHQVSAAVRPGLTIVCTISGVVVNEELDKKQQDNLAMMDLEIKDNELTHKVHKENSWLMN